MLQSNITVIDNKINNSYSGEYGGLINVNYYLIKAVSLYMIFQVLILNQIYFTIPPAIILEVNLQL